MFEDTTLDVGFVEVDRKSDCLERREDGTVGVVRRDEERCALIVCDFLDRVDQFGQGRFISHDIVQMDGAFFQDPRERAAGRDEDAVVDRLKPRSERFFFDLRAASGEERGDARKVDGCRRAGYGA